MNTAMNLSSSPHVRSRLRTDLIMYCVIAALLPATVVGVINFGVPALLVILVSVATAVFTEFVFDKICKKPNTIGDGSAALTGLLLALCLPSSVPLYIPFLGALFAVLIAKNFFGGLGKNFINPALAGRCFLLISFSQTVTTFKVDGVSSATPLADLAAGKTVNVTQMFLGTSNGVIGCSIGALLIGGLVLLVFDIITWEIPVAVLGSFVLFMGLFGGQGFDPKFLLAHLAGGGIVMGAFFMATDYVTSPVSTPGQLIFGALIGILSGLFRVKGSAADSVSYAIIISNLAVPLIDLYIAPKPFAYRKAMVEKRNGAKPVPFWQKVPKSALILCLIALVTGVALSGVYTMTKDTIEAQQMAANAESYKAVVPDAETFETDEALTAAVDALGGEVYGTDYGRVHINDVIVGRNAAGEAVGYVISVTSSDGFDGDITLSMGIQPDGTLNGISFTELHETAGMGMRCDEPEFRDQFNGRLVSAFKLNKAGGSTAEDEINSVSGASISSGAVVNAVNAGLNFFETNVKGGE